MLNKKLTNEDSQSNQSNSPITVHALLQSLCLTPLPNNYIGLHKCLCDIRQYRRDLTKRSLRNFFPGFFSSFLSFLFLFFKSRASLGTSNSSLCLIDLVLRSPLLIVSLLQAKRFIDWNSYPHPHTHTHTHEVQVNELHVSSSSSYILGETTTLYGC